MNRCPRSSRYLEITSPIPGARVYLDGPRKIIVSIDDGLLHLSISREDRYPNFDEIKHARYALLPDNVTMAMLFPPQSEYVNLHDKCFHLYQLRPTLRLSGGPKTETRNHERREEF